jgi:hypothetical protein
MSIIGISGKIGSGKDTVGKIIQYLTANEEVKQVTTLEEWLDSDDLNGRDFNWKIKKFAGKLKQIASLLTGVDVKNFEDQDFKQQQMPEDWNMTYRTFLQNLGTEAMRDGLHTNVWVNALFADYKPYNEKETLASSSGFKLETELIYPNWIITDMRFPNELKAVKDRGGITIRVEREIKKSSKEWQEIYPDILVLDPDGWNRDERYDFEWNQELITLQEYQNKVMRSTCKFKVKFEDYFKQDNHPSETALDNAEFDYELINDGTLEDFIEKVREILIKEKII